MKTRTKHRFLCLLLVVLMIVSLLPMAALAAEVETSTWEKVDLDKITEGDVVAITMTKGSDIWVLPTEAVQQPLVVADAASVAGDTLTTKGASDDFGWQFSSANDDSGTYTISGPNGSLYIDGSKGNNGLRIGETQGQWSLEENHLKAMSTANVERYLGVYIDNQKVPKDWRAYDRDKNGNIKNVADQEVGFWKLTDGETPEPTPTVVPTDEPTPEPTISTVKEALDGADGAAFTVKGVVTLVAGKNVYVQDETGGICLYLNDTDSSIQLGDTLIGTGAKKVFNGLPELEKASVEKSEGMKLTAKETTIGALTAADVCTYVTIRDLTVTKIEGDNTTVADSKGDSINIFKPVLGDKTLKVGDVITFTGAVGIYNDLQLRNTVAEEIVVKGETPDDPPQPGGTTYGLASRLADGDKVILYNAKNGAALGNTIASHKVSGVAVTPVEGVITTDNEAVVWTVGVNGDGTYTFKQGDKTLGGVVSGTYTNLVVTGAASVNWTLTGPDSSDFNYFLRLDDMSNSYGKMYLEYYDGFTLYGSNDPTKDAFGITFYKQGAEPETPGGEPVDKGDLITNLNDLDGKTVAIYSPGHKTAISTKPNGDWYLKAQNATVENGKVVNFTADFVWTAKKNDNGTYSFYAYGDESRSITVWPSSTYAELSLNVGTYPDNTWTLTPAKTADCFYASSPTVSGQSGPAYIEAFVRNEFEVFSGYFTKPTSSKFTEKEFALQFYLVDPNDAVAAMDDGEWDGVLTKGAQYVIYNADAQSSVGLFDEANFSMKAIPTTIAGEKAKAGNGAYVFTVDTMGRYYTFTTNGKLLATNNSEELLLIDKNDDGSVPETAKWFLQQKDGGYILYNKEASYNGTPVCIEYYSSVFSGWTFSTKNPVEIYLFNFYPVADGTKVYGDIVQDPTVKFDGEDVRCIEQDYSAEFTLDDLAPAITSVKVTYTVGSKTAELAYTSENERNYSFEIPAADLDSEGEQTSFTVQVEVTNSYGLTYTGEMTVAIVDEPFFSNPAPRPNSQTRKDMRPTISVKVGNVGDDPTFVMQVNEQPVEATFADGVLSYTPAADLEEGRVAVYVSVTRADGASAEKNWAFIAGYSEYQHYYGQLHSHTTYSDGSGTLEAALSYVSSLPESANVQFVAFTDHSNYFDTASAANPVGALNDKSLMTDASREKWETYKNTVAAFNAKHDDLIAIAGFEMTWSGGPGHINTYDSEGLVSRNNASLNSAKNGDNVMQTYYAELNKGNSLNQFNHPGTTFGNFSDFNYYTEETDQRMFLVEVGNGEGQIGAGGYYPSYEQYTMALDKGWHVAPTNNQDNHKGRWGNANDARDVVLADDFGEQGIYDAIRNCRVYATEDKNLDLNYFVNEMPMGTIFPEAPEQLEVVVNVFDPDAHETISKVELIGNSGKVVHTWDNATDIAAGELTATITEPSCSYYYVRVTQKDGDLAVTAPVWVGDSISVGIQDVTCETEQPIVNETIKLQTTLFNSEDSDVTVKSLVYTTDGSKVLGTDAKGYTIKANGTVDVPFEFKTDTAKRMTIKVTAVITVNGIDLTYTKDITISVRENAGDLPVTAIKDVQAQTEAGHEYAIVGTVTSNASGYDKDTAFFDCIYVQDETAGICCFPVSGEFKIGDKVHIEGFTDFYQGEAELQVEKIEVIGSGEVAPKETTAAAVNDGSVRGSLITVKGTVERFEIVNGLVQTIMVKDENGDVVRVFIDGYITTGKEVENLENGCRITVTGLASYDDTFDGPFPRIRIRDRADVICEHVHTLTAVAEVPAACEKTGVKAYWKCETCGKLFSDAEGKTEIAEPEVIPALGHDLTAVAEVPAACEKTGVKGYWKCETCGKLFSDAEGKTEIAEPETIAALGHDWDAGKVTKAPTTKAEGEMTYTCKRDPGHKKTEPIAKLDKCDGGKTCPSIKLTDVDRTPDSWYHEAVDWAYVKGVTKGTSETAFSPDAACTRAQAVTFLWRAMGSPDPKSTKCDFTDVEAGAYYYKAVLWAVEHEITNGVGGNRFDPDGTCNRAQIVTFLWRAENKPAPKGAAKFPDVAAGTWYTDAVAWAVEHKITNGMPDGTFKPNDKCTRAQIVTFLWRDMTNK